MHYNSYKTMKSNENISHSEINFVDKIIEFINIFGTESCFSETKFLFDSHTLYSKFFDSHFGNAFSEQNIHNLSSNLDKLRKNNIPFDLVLRHYILKEHNHIPFFDLYTAVKYINSTEQKELKILLFVIIIKHELKFLLIYNRTSNKLIQTVDFIEPELNQIFKNIKITKNYKKSIKPVFSYYNYENAALLDSIDDSVSRHVSDFENLL